MQNGYLADVCNDMLGFTVVDRWYFLMFEATTHTHARAHTEECGCINVTAVGWFSRSHGGNMLPIEACLYVERIIQMCYFASDTSRNFLFCLFYPLRFHSAG